MKTKGKQRAIQWTCEVLEGILSFVEYSTSIASHGGAIMSIGYGSWKDREAFYQRLRESRRNLNTHRNARPNVLRVLRYLECQKNISVQTSGKGIRVEILPKGVVKILQSRAHNKKHKKWDGRLRMVVFDVPETHRRTRDMLRRYLRILGFVQIQKSVFVMKEDRFEEVQLFIRLCKIEAWVRCFTVIE